MRKIRSDSTMAAVGAFQRLRFNIPGHITLRECDLPFWNSALACRDDWGDHELDMVAQLARALADCERLGREIETEGEIIKGKPNLKFALAETLSRRAMSLTRHLQIHARATRGEARAVSKRKPAEAVNDKLIPTLKGKE